MKAKIELRKTSLLNFFIIFFSLFFVLGNAQVIKENDNDVDKPETVVPVDIYWDVKAYNKKEAKLLKIKAIDEEGNIFNVKAIQTSDETSIMNVKALVDGKKLSVKMLTKGEKDTFYPVKAIDEEGNILGIKAITEDGEILNVKGFSRSGNIIHLRAITKDYRYFNIIAISPDGKTNAVKGIKMMDDEVEGIINNVPFYAHIKAIKYY